MSALHPELAAVLAELRAARGFEVLAYVRAKVVVLDAYVRRCGIRAAVVGVSGGVDSAVALGLLARAAKVHASPLERVVAALMPVDVAAGATGQARALELGREVARAFGVEAVEIDLGGAHAVLGASVERALGVEASAWGAGQLVSTIRTPALYHVATLLTQAGLRCLVAGTTNRDEGAYLGFFGKASDGMVDLQPISDLHKSEVYQVAAELDVPARVRSRAPTGDTFDGRTDEEMIGVPYDAVELHSLLRCSGRVPSLGAEASAQLAAITELLEARHAENAHKYVGDSPAVHLDVHERAVPGGWRSPPLAPPRPVDARNFVGELSLASFTAHHAHAHEPHAPTPATAIGVPGFGEEAWVFEGVLSASECDGLLASLAAAQRVPVARDGRPGAGPVGAHRASAYEPRLAELLFARIPFPRLRVLDAHTRADAEGHPVWRAVGLSPLFRFITYRPGGALVPHHDGAYDHGDGLRRTLMSVLFFLTDGGATRLLLDRQRNLPWWERVQRDGDGPPPPREVLARVAPPRGSALVFDHHLPHDAEPWAGPGERVLVRTDVVFERCAARALPPLPRARRRATDDPFYAAVPEAQLDEAGWFDDRGAEEDVDPRWMVTPLHHVARRLDPGDPRPQVVLVSTGAFCPVHRGHLEMMEIAKGELERRGYAVLGGFLAPDHDAYVSTKCGARVPPAPHRVDVCERAVAGSDWLAVDPWPALHATRALNFTRVILRLESILAELPTARPIAVAYVFGSDNARFALAFASRGLAVSVPRPGFEDRAASWRAHAAVRDNPRVVFASTPAPEASSSAIREGDASTLPEDAAPRWRTWTRAPGGGGGARAEDALLYLRDEGGWAVEPWLAGRDGEQVRRAWAVFVEAVQVALRRAFAGAVAPDVPRALKLEVLALEEQRARAEALTRGERVLSLDPCIPGDVSLGVSRRYAVSTAARDPSLAARPGWPALREQLAAIPAGDYVLLDDDRVTGQTLAEVRAMLPARVRVTRVLALCEVRGEHPVVDLADARDFLAGAREGGLVVALPDRTSARAPYALPYVRPSDRLSAPLSTERALSLALWEANATFFAAITPAIRVEEASPAFQSLAAALGHAPTTPMEALARWHAAKLR